MQIHHLSIGSRLALAFSAVIFLTAAILGIGIWQLQAIASETNAMMERPLTKERLVSDWYRTIHTSVRRTTAVAKSSDPSLATFLPLKTQRPRATPQSSKSKSKRCWKRPRKKPCLPRCRKPASATLPPATR